MTIHIFGDSHGNFNFKNIKYNNVKNHYQNSITMHRVGRDGQNFINFNLQNIINNDIVIYQFGEIDCRCHIGKQLLLSRELDIIINELIDNYILSIKNNIDKLTNIHIIVCCIPPPMNQQYYESIHGPITHNFPFVGTNDERIKYTKLVNEKLEIYCNQNNFYFLNYYDHYENSDKLLKIDLSDNCCHIQQNQHVLEELYKIIDKIL